MQRLSLICLKRNPVGGDHKLHFLKLENWNNVMLGLKGGRIYFLPAIGLCYISNTGRRSEKRIYQLGLDSILLMAVNFREYCTCLGYG